MVYDHTKIKLLTIFRRKPTWVIRNLADSKQKTLCIAVSIQRDSFRRITTEGDHTNMRITDPDVQGTDNVDDKLFDGIEVNRTKAAR